MARHLVPLGGLLRSLCLFPTMIFPYLTSIAWACRNLDHAESGFINNFSWIFWTQQQ